MTRPEVIDILVNKATYSVVFKMVVAKATTDLLRDALAAIDADADPERHRELTAILNTLSGSNTMKADKWGTPSEQSRAQAGWKNSEKDGPRCDGCHNAEITASGAGGRDSIHCAALDLATKANAVCDHHDPVRTPKRRAGAEAPAASREPSDSGPGLVRWEVLPEEALAGAVEPTISRAEIVLDEPVSAPRFLPPEGVVIGEDDADSVGCALRTNTAVAVRDAHPTEIEPYDQRRVVAECRFYLGQSAEAMLEAGKRLIALKEHEPHGEFERIVETELGIPARTARRMMASAIKFSSPLLAAKRPTLAVLEKSKLFELLTEDDEELAGLADGGTLAGLTIDEVDRMSVRELRAALRKQKAEAEIKLAGAEATLKAARKVSDDYLRENQALKEEIHGRKLKGPDPDAIAEGRRAGLSALAREIKSTLMTAFAGGTLRLIEHGDQQGYDERLFVAGLLVEIEREIHMLRDAHGLPETISVDPTPEWIRPHLEGKH